MLQDVPAVFYGSEFILQATLRGEDGVRRKRVVWLALNAKYTHTSLAVRYLREVSRGVAEAEILELTIQMPLLTILGAIYERRPKILGISCYIWNIETVKALLPLLPKAMPELTILCGGPEVSYDTGAFLRAFPMVGYVIRGEGEVAVKDLLRYFGGDKGIAREDIAGLAWRNKKGTIYEGSPVVVESLDDLPFAYREEEMAALRERILYYESSRGCPFSCAYCLSGATAGVRFLPLPRVFKELAFFVAHDVRQVKFVDRTFNASKAHFLPIMCYILDLPETCRTNFHFEVAADHLDEEAIAILQQMPKGRVQLEVGIQSTNPQTLEKIRRVNCWERIAAAVQALGQAGNIHLHVDLIIGLPEEDMMSLARSFNDVYALQPDMLQIGFLKFLKGAAMMEQREAGAYQYMDIAPYEVLTNRWLSYGEIQWLKIMEMVFSYYYNAGRCRTTIEWLIRAGTKGDAFSFYRMFTRWWERCGYHRRAHRAAALYDILLAFAQQAFRTLSEIETEARMRFDALARERGSLYPPGLDWNQQRYQAQTARFWRQGGAASVLPGYKFSNWHTIRQHYHIEWFPVDVTRPEGGEGVWLLFDFSGQEPLWRRLDEELLA